MASDSPIGGTIFEVRAFGIPIRFHFTFVLLLVFLLFIGIGGQQSGAFTALYVLALFGSVLLHELGHALAARRYDVKTLEIVMFPIGGLARLDRQPKAREELWIALAGPAVNLVIAAGFGVWLHFTGSWLPISQMMQPTDQNLAQRIASGNLLLALFNMLPAFPMDGGRVLRAILALSRPEQEATRIAAGAGQVLAILMGLYGLLVGHFLLVFVAMFVYLGAAHEAAVAHGQTLARGFPVSAAMITDFRTLRHGDSIRDAGNLLLSTSQQDFPVMLGDQVVGLLTRAALIRALVAQGPDSYVAGAMDREFTRLAPDTQLSDALPAAAGQCSLVMDGDRLVGLLTAENISEFLVLRQVGLMRAGG